MRHICAESWVHHHICVPHFVSSSSRAYSSHFCVPFSSIVKLNAMLFPGFFHFTLDYIDTERWVRTIAFFIYNFSTLPPNYFTFLLSMDGVAYDVIVCLSLYDSVLNYSTFFVCLSFQLIVLGFFSFDCIAADCCFTWTRHHRGHCGFKLLIACYSIVNAASIQCK